MRLGASRRVWARQECEWIEVRQPLAKFPKNIFFDALCLEVKPRVALAAIAQITVDTMNHHPLVLLNSPWLHIFIGCFLKFWPGLYCQYFRKALARWAKYLLPPARAQQLWKQLLALFIRTQDPSQADKTWCEKSLYKNKPVVSRV